MELAIKNMVCNRCIKVVKQLLEEQHVEYAAVQLGKVWTKETLSPLQLQQCKQLLQREGFDLIEEQKLQLTEQVKNLLLDLIYQQSLEERTENISSYLSHKLHRDYTGISQLFSSVENITIEQFFILQKIERVKELLVYEELNLSEIAFKMGYSSVAHLSSQFKKITGFTPSQFRELKDHHRKPIDQL